MVIGKRELMHARNADHIFFFDQGISTTIANSWEEKLPEIPDPAEIVFLRTHFSSLTKYFPKLKFI